MKDYYDILGISRSATKDEIKRAYRDLAHKFHPDKKGGNEQRFKEINEAYQTLSDDQKRAQYDRFGKSFDQTSWGGDFSGWEDLSGAMHDIFEDFFGGAGMKARERRGRDISIDIELPFEEAIFGTRRRVLLRKLGVCDECAGSGVAVGSKEQTCSRCRGAGTIHTTKRSLLGSITHLAECSVCRGRGKVPEKKCVVCGGIGNLPKSEEVLINVPAGIQAGEMIRLEGQGEAIAGGEAGDLYARIHVRSHPTLKRAGRDLITRIEIPLSEAILGGKREIKTLDGPISVTIPGGIADGEILKVRGKGVPTRITAAGSAAGRGDLLIEVKVVFPKRINERVRKLIEDLRKEGL